MKKLILVAVAALAISFSADAKLYLGGTAGFAIQGSTFQGRIAPEVGYSFNDKFAAGGYVFLGGASGTFNWSINPYFRWTFYHFHNFGLFAEGTFGIGTTSYKTTDPWGETVKGSVTNWEIMAVPGLSYTINGKIQVVGRLGGLGYTRSGDAGNFAFVFNLAPTIGVVYCF